MARSQIDAPISHKVTREQARTKLQAAGLLSSLSYVSEDIRPLSDAERARLGALLANTRSSEKIVDDDRGPY